MANHPNRGANAQAIKAIREATKQACKLSDPEFINTVAQLPEEKGIKARYRRAALGLMQSAIGKIVILHLRAMGYSATEARALSYDLDDYFWQWVRHYSIE